MTGDNFSGDLPPGFEDLTDAERRSRGGNGADYNTKSNGDNAQPAKRVAVLLKASDIDPEPIDWAWKDRFAFGKLALIAGTRGSANRSRQSTLSPAAVQVKCSPVVRARLRSASRSS